MTVRRPHRLILVLLVSSDTAASWRRPRSSSVNTIWRFRGGAIAPNERTDGHFPSEQYPLGAIDFAWRRDGRVFEGKAGTRSGAMRRIPRKHTNEAISKFSRRQLGLILRGDPQRFRIAAEPTASKMSVDEGRRAWVEASVERREMVMETYRSRQSISNVYRYRGGSSESDGANPMLGGADDGNSEHDRKDGAEQPREQYTYKMSSIPTRMPRASDFIVDLSTRSGVDGTALSSESLDLRSLIAQRTADHLQAMATFGDKHWHPNRLLHYLAPKIPAIKHSPDVGLRIRSARSDMDSGVAACLVGTLGHVCEIFKKQGGSPSVVEDIVNDRRFEQLVECLLCGVNVEKRRKEWLDTSQNRKQMGRDIAATERIEVIVDEALVVEGLSIRDSCRAAWGISILGVHKTSGDVGGTNILDLLRALSLRIRDLLLVRLKKLRHSDLDESTIVAGRSIDERLNDFSDELAEDAAIAMWTFACVQVNTGICSRPLVAVCCSILCADPFKLRQLAQEAATFDDMTTVGSNDVVERLALSEMEVEGSADYFNGQNNETGVTDRKMLAAIRSTKGSLLLCLSPKALADTIWASALVGGDSPIGLANIYETFRATAFDCILEWFRKEFNSLESSPDVRLDEPADYIVDDALPNTTTTQMVPANSGLPFTQDMQLSQTADTISRMERDPGYFYALDDAFADSTSADLECMTITDGDDHVNEINVIDASTMLALELAQDGATSIKAAHFPKRHLASKSSTFWSDEDNHHDGTFQLFSPHDLCTIAWAATELNDSLRGNTTAAIVKLIFRAGKESLKDLPGGDLSSLAWAIAKNIKKSDDTFPHVELGIVVTQWIIDEILQPERGTETSATAMNLMQRFRPPETSRLLWSIAAFYTSRVDKTSVAWTGASELGHVGLMTAASHMDDFCPEDLVRGNGGNIFVVRLFSQFLLRLGSNWVGLSNAVRLHKSNPAPIFHC